MALPGVVGPSTLTTVFRQVERTLRASPYLSRAVGAWRTYADRDPSSGKPAVANQLTIELFPYVESQEWESPDSHTVWLAVAVRMTFDGKSADDYLDVWTAVLRAVYPPDQADRLALQETLRGAGAVTGEPQIQWPTPTPAQAGSSLTYDFEGHVRYQVRLQLNS